MISEQIIKSKSEEIAKEVLSIDTLETRKSDSLDFYDLSVWQIEKALRKAYIDGFLAGGSE